MFSRFFIERPKFAMVVSIVLSLAGLLSVFSLPISLYPQVTPPEVNVGATYTGASAEVVASSIGIPMEEEINGVEGMIYMNSTSSNTGSYSLSVTFETDVDPDMAQVKLQNRLQQAESKLPTDVTRQGLTVKRRSSDTLGFIAVGSPKGTRDSKFLTDYVENNLKNNIIRVDGVGEVSVNAASLSMRVWLDVNKVTSLGMSVDDIVAAIESQNVQPSLGSVGSSPSDGKASVLFNLQTLGRLNDVETFENIIIRTNEQGGVVRLKDVAKIGIGEESYLQSAEFDGQPNVSIGLNLLTGANALDTMAGIKAEIARLQEIAPEDVEIKVAYDATKYIESSIDEVVMTLFLTFLLVVLVCYVFLQDWRATLIPVLTIPVSLLATFAVFSALGYSINLLTLLGLVLAIGLVVDDAIVVVERVLAIMESENLPPKQATIKAMEEVSGAVVATTLVLLAIFVPVAFLGGIPGKIYQQFAVAISTAVVFSSLNALTLSPALCGTILRPLKEVKHGFLHWFNVKLNFGRNKYTALVGAIGRKTGVVALFLGMFVLATFGVLKVSSSSFLPAEDQGVIFTSIQLPEGATKERTYKLVQELSPIFAQQEGVSNILAIQGMSFMGGGGENVASVVIMLEPWADRTSSALYSTNILNQLRAKVAGFPEAEINFFEPPSIPGLGMNGGIDMRLQAFDNADPQDLDDVAQSFLAKVMAMPEVMFAFTTYTAKTPNIFLEIDRDKAQALDVDVSKIFSTLQRYLGSSYINDVNFGTQVNKVMVQADWKFRKNIESINELYVISNKGKLVPMSALVDLERVLSPRNITRYNQYPSANLTIVSSPKYSTGDVMAALTALAKVELPDGYGFQWSGMTYQEQDSQGQISYLIILALVFAYLFLVAQYESWTTPVPVLLSVFVAMFGALLGLFISHLSLSIYSQLGLILLVGLSAKNAILIVEFSKVELDEGKDVVKAAMIGTKERFRAVLMTAFTFILGVLPMIVATGAGASARKAIGVPVFTGMLFGTVLGLIAIPLLFILVFRVMKKEHRKAWLKMIK